MPGARTHMWFMRALALVIPLLVILALTAWWATALWTSIEGPPMPTSGHVAMWLGIILSMLVGCGLMALMFFSSRRGYDDRASRHDTDRP
jgi:Na+-driven multidrug efflux pump